MRFSFCKRAVSAILVVVAVTISTSAVAEKRLSIATGPTAGVYFPMGAAVAKVIAAHVPDVTAGHDATSASADNIRLIAAGKADIAFSQADTAWDGFKGYGSFSAPQPIRTLAVLYPNNLHVVTLANSGINKVSDLRGKRVSTGPAKSGTEIWAERLLTANGLDPAKDIQRQSLGPAESATALKEGKLDAFVWSSGIPVKAIADLAKEPGVKIKLLDTALAVPTMLRRYGPVYTDGEIPANTYAGVSTATKVAQVWNLLIVKDSMDAKLGYDIVNALFAHKAELVAGHKDAEHLDLMNQPRTSPISFHDGAKTFYKEKGLRIFR